MFKNTTSNKNLKDLVQKSTKGKQNKLYIYL